MKKLIFAAMAAIFMAPALSSAAVLDFTTGTAGAGGTIVDTGTGDVQGMDIFIDTLVATETSADGVYNVDGALACATGGGGSCAALSFDTAAGTFTIVGSVPGLVGPTTLLSGTIDSFTFNTTPGGLATFFATGTDTKAEGLLEPGDRPSHRLQLRRVQHRCLARSMRRGSHLLPGHQRRLPEQLGLRRRGGSRAHDTGPPRRRLARPGARPQADLTSSDLDSERVPDARRAGCTARRAFCSFGVDAPGTPARESAPKITELVGKPNRLPH